MRVRSRWFRHGRPRDPGEIAGAAASIAWRLACGTVARMRKAGFSIDAGPTYFEVLSETLAFAIQVSWREALARLDEPARDAFIRALSLRVASIAADNEADLLGERARDEVEAAFIARLNARFEAYAGFGYAAGGPDFAFLRYFASLVCESACEGDRRWVHDQVIAIEGPEVAATMARALAGLIAPQASVSAQML